MHADDLLGHDPYGSFLSQWLSNGGAYYRVPTPHARVPHDLGLSLLVTGVWLENHLTLSIFTVEVPRPEASMPCLCAAPSTVALTHEPASLRGHFPNLLYFPRVPPSECHHVDFGQRPRPVNARGWSTPEFNQRPRTGRYISPPVSSCQLVQRRDYGLALPTYVASRDRTCTVH